MWAQILSAAIGIWLMTAPNVLGYDGAAADVDHITGPVVTSFAVIALSGCTRAIARFNIPCGAWLLLAPWILGYDNNISIGNDVIAGILIVAFSFIKRTTRQQYGGGWTQLVK